MALPPEQTAARFLPQRHSLDLVRAAASGCTACDLYKNATQTVFGEGAREAELMVVGEVPGDEEDRAGHPFVGPAGRVLDEALEEAGIERDDVYVTNAVKHFKWKPVGKRRLHQKPNATEIEVCRPWLAAEVDLVKPRVIVAMGGTAARSLLARSITIGEARMRPHICEWGMPVVVTYHPSAALRGPEPEDRRRFREMIVLDLRMARRLMG